MDLRPISFSTLTGLGLLIGMTLVPWTSGQALPPVQQEYCSCDCGGEPVSVIPTAGSPNASNCKAMTNKACRNPKTGNTNALTCGGNTIVQRPKGPQIPPIQGPDITPAPGTPIPPPVKR